jgi:threonyl-tRNA synthetase
MFGNSYMIIALKQNDEVIDTQSLDSSELCKFESFNNNTSDEAGLNYILANDNNKESLDILRHSTAHLMASAIKALYNNAKFYVGPVIEDGFYYDFSVDETITNEDLKKIQTQMLKIAKKNHKITKYFITLKEARNKFKDDELKNGVLDNLEKRYKDNPQKLSIYKQDDFEDLCAGPHIPNTSLIRFFKLTALSGVHFKANTKQEKHITRIYGTAFFEKQALNDYMAMLLEASKRDHRKLGKELKLFDFEQDIGAGLPLWLPNGGRLRAKLEQLLFKAHRKRGYEPIRSPEILKSDAWIKSGHYENYKENMYFTTIDEQEYGLKPMNCVGHCEIFKKQQITYKQLPIKFFEYGIVHRHELSGVMHGLFRVREFTQDDAHIYCDISQVKKMILEILEFIDSIMKLFNFTYELSVSTKPSKAIGSDEFWENTTNAIKNALDEANYKYDIDEGGGAFYGPKIDIKILDSMKRKWQCSTVQVDMNLPERLDINYINNEGIKTRPVMIHRAILGSFERFIGILIEHCGGELPIFLAPNSVIFVPINNNKAIIDYIKQIQNTFFENDIDSDIYDSDKHLNTKIKLAEKQKVAYIAVVGENELKNNTLSVRDRVNKTQININKEEFIEMIKQQIKKGNI